MSVYYISSKLANTIVGETDPNIVYNSIKRNGTGIIRESQPTKEIVQEKIKKIISPINKHTNENSCFE